ncbi:MAG: TIGR02391 family protein [Promethearchaeota archaeon]
MKEIEARVGGNFSTKQLEKDSAAFLKSVKELRENVLDTLGLPEFPKPTERISSTIREIRNIKFSKPREIFRRFINDHLPKTRVSRDSQALMEGIYIPTQLYCEAIAHEAKKVWELANDFIKLVQRLNKQLYDVKGLAEARQNNVDIKLENLHQEILTKCSKLYNDGSYAEAVEKGFKVVRDRLRDLTSYEKGSDAFGKGRLHIKGAAASNVDFDFNEAVKFLTMAIDFFRNEKSHTSDANIDDPVRAYEYLRLSSLAMHLLENAEIKNKKK